MIKVLESLGLFLFDHHVKHRRGWPTRHRVHPVPRTPPLRQGGPSPRPKLNSNGPAGAGRAATWRWMPVYRKLTRRADRQLSGAAFGLLRAAVDEGPEQGSVTTTRHARAVDGWRWRGSAAAPGQPGWHGSKINGASLHTYCGLFDVISPSVAK